jgi:hypothetical protein
MDNQMKDYAKILRKPTLRRLLARTSLFIYLFIYLWMGDTLDNHLTLACLTLA